jgi:hypothetical protein
MRANWRRFDPPGFERITFGDRSSRSGWRPGSRRDRPPLPVARPALAWPPDGPPTPVIEAGPHWNAWVRAAVRLMEKRTTAFVKDNHLQGHTGYWSLADPRLVFPLESDQAVADLCVIGSLRASTAQFRWAWADDAVPPGARRGLERVHEFGELSALDALTTPAWPAGWDEALELASVAGRILYAAALWVAASEEITLFFALSPLRRERHASAPGQ